MTEYEPNTCGDGLASPAPGLVTFGLVKSSAHDGQSMVREGLAKPTDDRDFARVGVGVGPGPRANRDMGSKTHLNRLNCKWKILGQADP